MAKTDKTSPEAQEIIAGQNEIERLPKEFNERVKLLDNEKTARERVNDKIAQVKKDAGLADIERNLTESWGYTPQALKINRMLDGMPARSRAATIRQINLRAEDKGWVLPDMFDQASARGPQAEAEPATEQRSTEEMAASHETPQRDPLEVHVTSAEAREQLETYLIQHPRKRGAKPKELTRLEEQLDAALAREGAQPDNVVKLGGQMRGTADAGEAHIKEQLEREAAKQGAKATDQEAAAPSEKKTRTRGKKADAPAVKADAPPSLDDDEGEEAPDAPAPPGEQIGTVPASFRMG